MTNRIRLLAGALFVALTAPLLITAPATAACDPSTPPVHAGAVPSPQDVLGFPIGSQEVTADEILTYLSAVDAASDRVITARAATSVQGRPIRYAMVGHPARVTPAALATLSTNLDALRDPLLPDSQAATLAASTPRMLWLAGNVHGGEESGADASLQILYDLADRSDCAATAILDGAVVGIMPTQNPDGRELETRRNANGFDMNRDWFARTQPETDGKIEVLRRYPPMLFIDEHEFGAANYLFPPHADPEYHETPDQVHDWIFDLYGPAMEAAFDREGLRYHHGAPYDFFASVFGDTVPAVGLHAAGMTFEKANDDPIADRTREQYLSAWTSLSVGAAAPGMVANWHASFVRAYQEGLAGALEPNAVYNEGSTLLQPVPDVRVRHYFVFRRADRRIENRRLVQRLQRMDVEVYRLTAPLVVPDLHGYDGTGRDDFGIGSTLPTGTYWIPLAQGQKHWIQSMLHDETFIPTDITYDVTAWSNPQLMNLAGGWSGSILDPASALVAPIASVPSPRLPEELPGVAILENVRSTRGFESAGQLRWLFDTRWHLPYTDVTPDDVRGGLPGIDVLVMPAGFANYLLQDLGAKGKRALRDWVAAGGRLVAWQGGAEVAARAGASTIVLHGSHTNMPGSLIRADLDPASPLAAGVGPTVWIMYRDDDVMSAGLGDPVTTIGADAPVNGLDEGAAGLHGSAPIADEVVGAGRIISFSFDPNFRGWTDGTQKILWNAILGPDPVGTGRVPLGSARRASAERVARAAARALPPVGDAPLRLEVARADARATATLIRGWGAKAYRMRVGASVLFQVANRRDLSSEEHRFVTLLDLLRASSIRIRWASVP